MCVWIFLLFSLKASKERCLGIWISCQIYKTEDLQKIGYTKYKNKQKAKYFFVTGKPCNVWKCFHGKSKSIPFPPLPDFNLLQIWIWSNLGEEAGWKLGAERLSSKASSMRLIWQFGYYPHLLLKTVNNREDSPAVSNSFSNRSVADYRVAFCERIHARWILTTSRPPAPCTGWMQSPTLSSLQIFLLPQGPLSEFWGPTDGNHCLFCMVNFARCLHGKRSDASKGFIPCGAGRTSHCCCTPTAEVCCQCEVKAN